MKQEDCSSFRPFSFYRKSLPFPMVICTNCGGEFPSRSKLFKHLPTCLHETNKDGGSEDEDGVVEVDEDGVVEVVEREPGFFQVVVKPQGMPTMGGRTASGLSMQNHPALVIEEKRVTEQSHLWKVVRAVPVHRLDSATGGLLICAESTIAEQSLRCAFRERLVHKRYRAVVVGLVEQDVGTITLALSGQDSRTEYKVVSRTPCTLFGGGLTTLDLFPVTGRRHQLRRHLAAISHTIVGDFRYRGSIIWPASVRRLYLWACEVSFPHPATWPGGDSSMVCTTARMVTVTTEEPPFYKQLLDSATAAGVV